MPGNIRTPKKELEKRGSPLANRNEPDARDGELHPTRRLSAEAQKAWARICVELEAIGYLSPTYAEMVTIAADAIGDIEIASNDLIERGHISITERGETKNPSFTIKTSAQGMAYKYLTALGLSPTAIGKLTGTKKEEENPFEALLKRKQNAGK